MEFHPLTTSPVHPFTASPHYPFTPSPVHATRRPASLRSGVISNQPVLKIRTLDPRATRPAYQTPGSAGLDISACLPESTPRLSIAPMQIVTVPTGLAIAIPEGFEGQVRARSGLSTKHGIGLPNAPGTIDSDYRGELRIALINLGQKTFEVEHAMRIAQLVIAPVARVQVQEVESLDETMRGTGGFGSTGV